MPDVLTEVTDIHGCALRLRVGVKGLWLVADDGGVSVPAGCFPRAAVVELRDALDAYLRHHPEDTSA